MTLGPIEKWAEWRLFSSVLLKESAVAGQCGGGCGGCGGCGAKGVRDSYSRGLEE